MATVKLNSDDAVIKKLAELEEEKGRYRTMTETAEKNAKQHGEAKLKEEKERYRTMTEIAELHSDEALIKMQAVIKMLAELEKEKEQYRTMTETANKRAKQYGEATAEHREATAEHREATAKLNSDDAVAKRVAELEVEKESYRVMAARADQLAARADQLAELRRDSAERARTNAKLYREATAKLNSDDAVAKRVAELEVEKESYRVKAARADQLAELRRDSVERANKRAKQYGEATAEHREATAEHREATAKLNSDDAVAKRVAELEVEKESYRVKAARADQLAELRRDSVARRNEEAAALKAEAGAHLELYREATAKLNSDDAVAKRVAELEVEKESYRVKAARADQFAGEHRTAIEFLVGDEAVVAAVEQAKEREEEFTMKIKDVLQMIDSLNTLRDEGRGEAAHSGESEVKWYRKVLPTEDIDNRTRYCSVAHADDEEMQLPFDFSQKGMLDRLECCAQNGQDLLEKIYANPGLDWMPPKPPRRKGRTLITTFASKEKGKKGLVVPCYRVRALPGGGIPGLSTGPPANPPRTVAITTNQADALLSPYYTFREYDNIDYDCHQALLQIDEVPFRNWLNAHFAGPLAESLHNNVPIGLAHWVRHPGAPPVASEIRLEWNAGNSWMVVRIDNYPRTICSPIFCFGLLYPTLVDAHNMADNHSSNIRIGWNKEDRSLTWKIFGQYQRTVNGFDSLVRFLTNNADILEAKKILELAVVAKVVPM